MSITRFVTDRQPHRVSDRDNGYVPLDKTLEWLAERTQIRAPKKIVLERGSGQAPRFNPANDFL
jgi:hypothetical protein